MFHIAVCEDCPKEIEAIISLLNEYKAGHVGIEIHIQHFKSGIELLERMKNGKMFDLFLFDILMPDISGLELAQKVREIDEDVPIVFLTSSADYAFDAYRVSAVQYILKPIDINELFPVIDKVIAINNLEKEKFFMLSTSKEKRKIPYSAIVYIELKGHVMHIHLKNGEIHLSKSLRIPFQDAIEDLLVDDRFAYGHKSFVLNMEHVQKMIGRTFVMLGGDEIPIPKYRLTEIKAKYMGYLSHRGVKLIGGE